MRAENKLNTKLGWRYRCIQNNCRATLYPTRKTWFENSHLTIYHSLLLVLNFVENQSVSQTERNCSISRKSVIDWFNFCREVCERKNSTHTQVIGGPYCRVEIDETLISKRKYDRGRLTSAQRRKIFVFGAYCRETKETVLFKVRRCNESTLWPLIKNHIAAGSIIHSDGAKVYEGLAEEKGEDYGMDFWNHDTVIHKEGEFTK